MTRNSLLSALALALALASVSSGCKTTEANYKAAYEKTIAAREEAAVSDSTLYGGSMRRQDNFRNATTRDGNVKILTQRVRVSKNSGGIAENLNRYNVVVGQFKQQFNACSLRDRWADSGYPSAFVVETGEPYYYVVLSSHNNLDEAAQSLKAIGSRPPVAIKEPCPFILDATARRQTTKKH